MCETRTGSQWSHATRAGMHTPQAANLSASGQTADDGGHSRKIQGPAPADVNMQGLGLVPHQNLAQRGNGSAQQHVIGLESPAAPQFLLCLGRSAQHP